MDPQVPRIPFFHILRQIAEDYFVIPNLIVPNLLIKSFRTSVEVVRPVVYRQMILLSPKGKLSVFDPVRCPSQDSSDIFLIFSIVLYMFQSKNNIICISFAVFHPDRKNVAPEICNSDCQLLILHLYDVNSVLSLFDHFHFCHLPVSL